MSVVPLRAETQPPKPVVEYLDFTEVSGVVDPNPHRDLKENPLTRPQIARLVLSMKSTGFWDNLSVRPHPEKPGRYQLASGHGRIAAALEAGYTSAHFVVHDYDDAMMLRMMVNENITQFGKDSFKTYKEAAIAAADMIMRDVIVDPERAAKYGSTLSEQDQSIKLVNAIYRGECPGRETIARFYSPTKRWQDSTLDPHDIELALVAFRETGALAAWHEKHNPKLKRKEPVPEPTINPEALRHFDKPAHVRSFVKAVTETKIPVGLQKGLAEKIVEKFGPEPAKGKGGRDAYQGTKEPNERFNAGNIRQVVIEENLNRTRNSRRKAQLERDEQKSVLERGLANLSAGLTRTTNGFHSIVETLEKMGEVTDKDMTVGAEKHLRDIRQALAEIQRFMAARPVRSLLKLKQE